MLTAHDEIKAARKRAAVSIAVNLALATGKGCAGVLASSTALIGDAIHSGADVIASGAAYIGLWVAGRKHPSFPYGLYKAETIATMVTGMAILLAAYEIGRQALLGPERIPDVSIALPVVIISLVIALGFGLLQLKAGKRLNSPALVADARDYLADSLSTSVVLIGLVADHFGFSVDRFVAIIVSLFVFRAGFQLFYAAIRDLMDASIDRDTERQIVNRVEENPHVFKVKKCLSRTAGGRIIIDLDVIMQTPSHETADRVADSIEDELPEEFSRIVMARVRPHYKGLEE
jgi:cation diffusion facilitator family transporter